VAHWPQRQVRAGPRVPVAFLLRVLWSRVSGPHPPPGANPRRASAL